MQHKAGQLRVHAEGNNRQTESPSDHRQRGSRPTQIREPHPEGILRFGREAVTTSHGEQPAGPSYDPAMPSPDQSPVLLLTGAPGVGKTTTARVFASRADRGVHLESDAFFHFIRAGYVEPWKPESSEQNTLIMRIVADSASAYAAGGYTTVVDGIILPRFFLQPLRESFRDAGHQLAYAVLRAPLEVCASRAATREARALGSRKVVERLWRAFADLGPLERHAIDIDGKSPDEAADLVAERVQDGSLAI
jgi:predicted kinase